MEDYFKYIETNAATIDEVLSDKYRSLTNNKSDIDLATRRIGQWCQSSANGGWSFFFKRLSIEGIDISEVLNRFSSIDRRDELQTSSWIEDARWIYKEICSPQNCIDFSNENNSNYPFWHLFNSLVLVAERKALNQLKNNSIFVNSDHLNGLRIGLFQKLTGLCSRKLMLMFDKYRRDNGIDSPLRVSKNYSESTLYRNFIIIMKNSGAKKLFFDAPVLLRLISVIVRQWIDSASELISRIIIDHTDICFDILNTKNLLKIVDIYGDISDPHNDGRQVYIIIFENNVRVVYKPRSCLIDQCMYDFINELNCMPSPIDLRSVKVISRNGYGWAAFIENKPCESEEEVVMYYRRSGAWLALFYLLGGADMHRENIIASGEHPIPIDIEMLFQPSDADIVQNNNKDSNAKATKIIRETVQRVGLLPEYTKYTSGSIVDNGGLSTGYNEVILENWINLNKDDMRLEHIRTIQASSSNAPKLNGVICDLSKYYKYFIESFSEYMLFFSDYKESIFALKAFSAFAFTKVRFVRRPTHFYDLLVRRLMNHVRWDDGIQWSAQADFMSRYVDISNYRKNMDLITKKERSDLLKLNIPFFTFNSNDKFIVIDKKKIKLFSRTGYNESKMRIGALDKSKIDFQSDIINAITLSARGEAKYRNDDLVVPIISNMAYINAAKNIFKTLNKYAINAGGSSSWICMEWLDDVDIGNLSPSGHDLYNGGAGIALFYAAYHKVFKTKKSLNMSMAAINSTRKKLSVDYLQSKIRLLGLGGTTGIGSLIYAFSKIQELLNGVDLQNDMIMLTRFISNDAIKSDTRLDVVGGSAGAILGLLSAYRITGNAEFINVAVRCGEHIIKKITICDGICRMRDSGKPVINGFSHGASGFVLSLASLGYFTKRSDFIDIAQAILKYETYKYDNERCNWPYIGDNNKAKWLTQWCHGAIGIGMARIALKKYFYFDAHELDKDIERAAVAAVNSWPYNTDGLCCGSSGNIIFLKEAGSLLLNENLVYLADRRLLGIIGSRQVNGGYKFGGLPERYNPGLFRGISGIGYTVLRKIDPSLPNILAFD